ncbi:MAG: FAD:protein FMN transferase [Planctomycetes bacterium]|nr:FAD:protein FMN transferase [Planctomycetota bacterium]
MQTTKTLIFRAAVAIMAIGMLFWFSQKNRTVTVDGGFRMTMGTVARIMVTAENQQQADKAINAAVDEIFHIDELMSDYDPNSQLSKVNRHGFDQPVPVDAELFEVLTVAKLYSCLSEGAFDITIGPVVQLWRKASENNIAPTADALQKAKECVGYKNLILDAEKQTVQFAKDGMFLDLGGIAKGYAIDKAIEILQNAGMKGAMVDIGGDLRCFGMPANGKQHWLIGLQDPGDDEKILLTLNMDNMAVATSGDYRRFVVIDDQKHSHIVNPATADSANDLSSVTLIAPTATAADALATAVTVLGNKKGLDLINKIENTEAILLDANQTKKHTKTLGADQYIQND